MRKHLILFHSGDQMTFETKQRLNVNKAKSAPLTLLNRNEIPLTISKVTLSCMFLQ